MIMATDSAHKEMKSSSAVISFFQRLAGAWFGGCGIKSNRPKGEPYVWFTGMGLALGIVMIVFLLGLIVYHGVEVFWPHRVVEVTLIEGSTAGIRGSNVLAGIVRKRQAKKVRTVTEAKVEQGSAFSEHKREWQLFVGNKDVYGFSFVYIDKDQIQTVRYPQDLMKIERLEYGDAIGYPLLLIEGGKKIPSDSPLFAKRLAAQVEAVNRRWREIRRIEKSEIGRINYEINKLRLKEKGLKRQKGEAGRELERLQERLEALQEHYQLLADRSQGLRAKQEENFLIYRLATGEEKKLALGQIVDYSYPNRLRGLERLGIFFKKMWVFVSTEPREANTEGGVFPAIFGTLVMTVLMSMAVTPFGVMAAIYLREYARQGFWVRAVRIAVNNLAGVPSIVFGVFGLGFFVYFVGGTIDQIFFKDALPTPTYGTGGILWASLTLALLTVPVVIVATEEALASVPLGMREGSIACGASKWQTIQRIVLPAALPGILTGLILAMARGAGEVAPLMLVGVVKLAPNLPIDGIFPYIHLERKFMHLGFHIYDLGFQSPDSEAAKPMIFATTLLLITLVIVLNASAVIIRERLRRKYSTATF